MAQSALKGSPVQRSQAGNGDFDQTEEGCQEVGTLGVPAKGGHGALAKQRAPCAARGPGRRPVSKGGVEVSPACGAPASPTPPWPLRAAGRGWTWSCSTVLVTATLSVPALSQSACPRPRINFPHQTGLRGSPINKVLMGGPQKEAASLGPCIFLLQGQLQYLPSAWPSLFVHQEKPL